VKIEAGLNIAEKRLPQDGRITKKIAGKIVDVRVSTIPTAKGERIVMRLLDKENILLELTDLGFDPSELHIMHNLIERPNGIVLVTGPTGSGKTTTLYACLNRINTEHRNILTAEDPVEYELKGIGQVQTQPKINLTFASAMRAFLRQDPDVIMVGEIRDHETAEIAIHASLTGHLVLSTLHTNDAPTAVTRLVDMGVQPFQISSSVMAVLAQRLVRRLCPFCRIPYTPTEANFQELGLDPDNPQQLLRLRQPIPVPVTDGFSTDEIALSEDDFLSADTTHVIHVPAPRDTVFYRAGGCDECSGLGYRGRVGIYELMVVTERIRREILANSDSNTILKVAAAAGMRTLREDGARKVLTGMTSIDEVLAATQAGEIGEID
jgi:general secretion pathway protein E